MQTFPGQARTAARLTATVTLAIAAALSTSASPLILKGKSLTLSLDPANLRTVLRQTGRSDLTISEAQSNLGPVVGLAQCRQAVSWKYTRSGLRVQASFTEDRLTVTFDPTRATSFTWPVVSPTPSVRALIWPRWEGCYIPLGDAQWRRYLIEDSPWDTLEGISMPFFGLDCGGRMLTYIAVNPYNNAISFSEPGSRLRAAFTHVSPRGKPPMPFGFEISLAKTSSPVDPARQYRRYLIRSRQFVTMEQKRKAVPDVARLLGAAHVYLWGDGLFTRSDVPPARWAPFCRSLVSQAERSGPGVAKRLHSLLTADEWTAVTSIAKADWPDAYSKGIVAAGISRALADPEFYDAASWAGINLSESTAALLAKDRERQPPAERSRLNCLLLDAAFPNTFLPARDWGDGVSLKMLARLKDAGLDRLSLCVDGWQAAEKHPDVVAEARRLGYLFGTYDSFHTIHDPRLLGTAATWDTAQFDDAALFKSGAIVGPTGRELTGFRKSGFKLSPIAARAAVEKRVHRNMAAAPFNYYFVDCDAYGEVYDDYSPLHPTTQAGDVAARLSRLAWIRDTFHSVIGSEGGSAYAASTIHVAEGMFGPGFGWGDKDLKDKASPYYLGAYYPPDGPRVFTQQVPLKDKWKYLYYDPRFRLPLYETVFHDSVVTTNHWSVESLKFSNAVQDVALTELLYQVPPMYHLNLDEFAKHEAAIKRHYAFFSPIHRVLGFQPMTAFDFLTPDRLVQRTSFGMQAEVVANFSGVAFAYRDSTVPARSVAIRWLKTGAFRTFTP